MISGFGLVSKEKIEDIQSEGYIYRHDSGLELVHIKNEDKNRVFSITFRTPSRDNTGVAHIVEHCVLAGSKKYPLKDPFNELIKSKLYSYLNAITFKDKTMYPIASYSEEELFSIADVYLDAVFNPLISERKEVFLQEGWHYNLDNIRDDRSYNGIVYNEMRSVYADTLYLLKRLSYSALFPNTEYKYDAGGCPNSIIELSYSEFLAYYEQTYIPKNACIYLYGDLETSKYLNHINSEYLNLCRHSIKKRTKINSQNPLKEPVFIYEKDESQTGKHLCVAFVIDAYKCASITHIIKILGKYLLEFENSPLRKELKKVGDSVEFEFETDLIQPTFFIFVKNTKVNVNTFKEVLSKRIKDVIEEGLDKVLIDICINKYEFQVRKEDYGYKPKGVAYNIEMISSFVYSKSISFSGLEKLEHIKTIRNKKEMFAETLIKYFLKNSHVAYISLEQGSSKKLYLDDKKKDRKQIRLDIDNMKKFQQSIEDKSIINKIKPVDISDISLYPEKYIAKIENLNGLDFVYTELDLNGAAVLSLSFDICLVPRDLLPYVGIYMIAIGKLGTKKYKQDEVSTGINEYFGEVNISLNSYTNHKNGNSKSFFEFKVELLEVNIEKISILLEEILLHTSFDDIKSIEFLLLEHKLKMESGYQNKGHEDATERIKANFSEEYKKREEIKGLEFYRYLRNICNDFESKSDVVISKLKELKDYLFVKESFTMLAVSHNSLKSKIQSVSVELHKCFPSKDYEKAKYKIDVSYNEDFNIKSEVNYNAMGFNILSENYKYSGKMAVLETILNISYLQNEVRIKGGAYGSSVEINRDGYVNFYSYRDPNKSRTYEIFKKATKFLQDSCMTKEEMQKYIIATINLKDRPMHIYKVGERSLRNLLCGITYDDLLREREEILQTTAEDIKKLAEDIDQYVGEACTLTIGNNKST